MAVYQGARLRPSTLPARAPDRGRVDRAALARHARARPVGVLMGVILGITMLLLVYLTQTLGSNATLVDLGTLGVERQDLERRQANQAAVVRLRADPVTVSRLARRAGLDDLGDVVVLTAP